jgi:hypothetical protein
MKTNMIGRLAADEYRKCEETSHINLSLAEGNSSLLHCRASHRPSRDSLIDPLEWVFVPDFRWAGGWNGTIPFRTSIFDIRPDF